MMFFKIKNIQSVRVKDQCGVVTNRCVKRVELTFMLTNDRTYCIDNQLLQLLTVAAMSTLQLYVSIGIRPVLR